MIKRIEYSIVSPGGNDTALVFGVNYSLAERKKINDAIMNIHSNVEQVGFIDIDKLILKMAGGEFCGNATRSAAFIFTKGKDKNITIKVNENEQKINAGVVNGEAWCQIPLYYGYDAIVNINKNIYKVKMQGMTTLVLDEKISKKYLKNKERIKDKTFELISEMNLLNCEAVGVMYIEREDETIKINPVVWVKSINTLFYETACGSGTTAVAMVEAYKNKSSQDLNILQPSGQVIRAKNVYNNNLVEKAYILGKIKILEDKNHFWI